MMQLALEGTRKGKRWKVTGGNRSVDRTRLSRLFGSTV
jgi:hypothetical protein